MKILFIVTSSNIGFWLAELTHPFWHLSERGIEIDFASPNGGKLIADPMSNPYSPESWETEDLVSRGFLSDEKLVARLEATLPLSEVVPDEYDGVHVVGGGGAAVDLYPNEDLSRLLRNFWEAGKFIGAICHGAIALANIPDLVEGYVATGFSRAEDRQVEELYGENFIPNFPQPVMEAAGITFVHAEPWGVRVVVDGKLITGQNQQSSSEYSIAYNHLLAGETPVFII